MKSSFNKKITALMLVLTVAVSALAFTACGG